MRTNREKYKLIYANCTIQTNRTEKSTNSYVLIVQYEQTGKVQIHIC